MKTKDNFTPWNQFDAYRGKEFSGEWPTIKELFHINTMRYPDNTCWKEYSPKEISLTYKEAEEKVKEVSSWFLSLGVKKGDKIIVSGKNSVAWAVTYIAVQYAGCTVVPLDSSLHDEDFIKFAKFSDSVVLVADNDRMKKVASSLPMLGYASLEENGEYPSIYGLFPFFGNPDLYLYGDGQDIGHRKEGILIWTPGPFPLFPEWRNQEWK